MQRFFILLIQVLCDSRVYEYLLPTYTLKPAKASDYPNSNLSLVGSVFADLAKSKSNGESFNMDDVVPVNESQFACLRNYRADADTLADFNKALNLFKGTHNFHNFTVGKNYKDSASLRYMLGLSSGAPFISAGTEWISIKIHG